MEIQTDKKGKLRRKDRQTKRERKDEETDIQIGMERDGEIHVKKDGWTKR
jgi:hypothetical protein